MAMTESDSDEEQVDSLAELKEKVRSLSKLKLEELLLTLMDEYDGLKTEHCMLKEVHSELKKEVRILTHENEILKSEKFKVYDNSFALCEDLDMLKETLNTRENLFKTNLSKLESESLQLKQKIEALTLENNQFLEKLKKTESDLLESKCWNSSLEALEWLNTHHNRNKKGLDFVAKRTVYPVHRKYAKVRGNNPGNNLGNNLWYVDNGCSGHMTGEKSNFLSLAASNGGSVTFENGKFGTIVGIGKIGQGSNPLKGDLLVIAGATLYAVSNVSEEFLVKNADRNELMAMLGMFGAVFSAIQISILERNELKSIHWSAGAALPFVGFSVAMFLFYSLVPVLLKMTGSTMLNLSLLTSDMWAVLIRIFAYHQKVDWLYFVAFAATAVGLVIYTWGDREERKACAAANEREGDRRNRLDEECGVQGSNRDDDEHVKEEAPAIRFQ